MKLTPLKNDSRTGTKIVWINWIVSISIIIFLNIILPIIGIWHSSICDMLKSLDVSATTIGLLGQGAITTTANEIRKAIENAAISKYKGKDIETS